MGNPITRSQMFEFTQEGLREASSEEQKYSDLASMIPRLFRMVPSEKESEEFRMVSGVPDVTEWNGRFETLGMYPGYSTRIEPGEFGGRIVKERKYIDDNLYPEIEDVARGLTLSVNRVREKNAVAIFGNITSSAFTFQTSEEGVSLASNSHTTRATGVSTASGFDNATTQALSPTALEAVWLQIRQLRNSIGERIESKGRYAIIHPEALTFDVEEIIGTDKGLYSPEGTMNPHKGRYASIPYPRLDEYSATSWGLVDLDLMKRDLIWIDRIKPEFNVHIDQDTLETVQSIYTRFGCGFKDWRWTVWSTV